MFELAMVNELSVFESSKFYYISEDTQEMPRIQSTTFSEAAKEEIRNKY